MNPDSELMKKATEVIQALLRKVERLEARIRELENKTAYPAGWEPPGR